MKTKIFTLLIAILASSTLSNAAIVNGECGENLTWSLNTKDSILTIEGSGKMTSTPWSDYREYIKYANLPDGLTNITQSAFFKCSSLTSIEIPNSVTSIGLEVFEGCSGLTSIEIPNGVKKIEQSTFQGCSGLTSVTIPNSVKSIGLGAFANCSSMTSVTIGNGITSIGNMAFNNCSGLTSLTVFATTPPSGGANCGINAGNCILYVPAEAVETYANAVWWEDFMQIKAIEGNLFTVDFKDWNGQLLARRFVENGQAAVAPTAPTREGYTFIGWDKDFSNVTSDLTVTALYKEWTPANYNFVFLNGTDNSLIGSKHVDFTLPNPPEVAGFTFSKWFVVAGEFENQIVFIAVYEYSGVPAVLPSEVSVPGNSNQKLIREGNVYILTSDHTFNAQGKIVK